MKRSIEEIKQEYELELDRIVKEINKEKAKTVLLQFPDGMKPYSSVIVDELRKKVDCEFFIWFSSCFGACDVPKADVDLIVQFGHSENLADFRGVQRSSLL